MILGFIPYQLYAVPYYNVKEKIAHRVGVLRWIKVVFVNLRMLLSLLCNYLRKQQQLFFTCRKTHLQGRIFDGHRLKPANVNWVKTFHKLLRAKIAQSNQ